MFAAVTLRWLHNNGECALLDCDFSAWTQGLLVAGEATSYDDFAAVDACLLLPCPAPQSLTGSGFLADSGPPHPVAHPADEWAFVECSHNFVVNTASVTDKDSDSFALVAPLNGQLVCGLCEDCTMDAHEDADGQLVPGLMVHICEGCQGDFHSHCIRDRLRPAAEVSDHGLSNVLIVDRPVSGRALFDLALRALCQR